MKTAPSRLLMAFIAAAAAFLTCFFLAARMKRAGGAIGLPLPWQYPQIGWPQVDYRILVGDLVFWLVVYYGLIRGLVLMWRSPHRLPFSRRRAYGEDPTAWPVRHLRTFLLVVVLHLATCAAFGVLGESVFLRIYPTIVDRFVQILTFPLFTVAALASPEGVEDPWFYALLLTNSGVWGAAVVGVRAFWLLRRRR